MASKSNTPPSHQKTHKEWYSRGHLPHLDHPKHLQTINFRLADALPAEVVTRLRHETKDDTTRSRHIEAYLDAGHGACLLAEPEIADLVEKALLHFDGQRYRLLAWCVMPNHVHTLIETLDG